MRFRVDVPVEPAMWKEVDECELLDELCEVSRGAAMVLVVYVVLDGGGTKTLLNDTELWKKSRLH